MAKKRVRFLLSLVLPLLLLFSGCKGEKPDQNELSASSVLTEEKSLPVSPTGYVTDEMYQRARLSKNENTDRLAAVLQKARNKQPVVLGVIGGSITQGALASRPENSYAALFKNWWTTAFPDSEITLVNAGIGATDSYYGVHRVDTDLLASRPDMVLVEYAVNDAGADGRQESYDALVRRILSADNSPAVLLLFTTLENGVSAQDEEEQIGAAYALPMLSYGNAVLPEISAGKCIWPEIGGDNTHPNDRGHAIIGELLWRYLNEVYQNMRGDETAGRFSAAPVCTEKYKNARQLQPDAQTFLQKNGFAPAGSFAGITGGLCSTGTQATLIYEGNFQNFGLVFGRTTDGTGGKAAILIDGQPAGTFDCNFADGWGDYAAAQEFFAADTAEKHRVEIRPLSGKILVLSLLLS